MRQGRWRTSGLVRRPMALREGIQARAQAGISAAPHRRVIGLGSRYGFHKCNSTGVEQQ